MLKRIALALILALPLSAVAAEDPKMVTWDDLVPQLAPIDNPFDRLDPKVLERLGYVVRAMEDEKLGLLREGQQRIQGGDERSRRSC